MAKKVILDVDPGIDDAVAICLALADPSLDVLAITAVGGNVQPDQATRNVHTIIEQLDPPRWPRLGAASSERMLRVDARHLFGTDGFCGAHFPVAELHHQRPSVKVISDEVRGAPGEVTIIATGPLSNIAAALQQQPDLAEMIGQLVILGGTVSGPGNVTPTAEFNVYCDAEAARDVFRSPVTKTIDSDRRHDARCCSASTCWSGCREMGRGRGDFCAAFCRVHFDRIVSSWASRGFICTMRLRSWRRCIPRCSPSSNFTATWKPRGR